MTTYTHIEDLSNEIFFEIFDYFNALDIFISFTSLNKRISSILQSIPLRIIITEFNCLRQINSLSSYLIHHDHQVISIKISDEIRDYSSIISLLFNRHNFINLQSCIFININPSTKLKNVIKKIKNLNRLVSFYIDESDINKNDKRNLTRTLLMHKSSFLRSISLHYPYHYLHISNYYTTIPSNLISLSLLMYASPSTISVYSILSILRICHTIQNLQITLDHKHLVKKNNINISIQQPSINDNDLPILSQLKTLDLKIFAICDSRSISYILRCMPNLIRFQFHLAISTGKWPFPSELLDGYVWKQMFEIYVPYLSIFEFHMSIMKSLPRLDIDIIVNSFEYFVNKYQNWHMVIDRWRTNFNSAEEFVMLRTLNFEKHKTNVYVNIPCIYWGSFETQSTTTINDHHVFYSNEKDLRINMTIIETTITWSTPLFQQVNYLFIHLPIKYSSLWNNLLNIFNFRQTKDDDDDDENIIIDYLSQFVHLSNITELEFPSTFDISRWKDLQFILQACPNVTDLIINTRLLVLSKLIDNSYLIPIFKQIKKIESITKNIYFPSNFALKFVQRFPSLTHIVLQVFSFDNCVTIIDTFLIHLKNLSFVQINYVKDTLLPDPFSCDYIINKRRETWPDMFINEKMIGIKNNGEIIKIWLL